MAKLQNIFATVLLAII
ncbi:hypothetical protein CXB51_019858 [Gossypium anomalum]|uniref:Uncharacterized protein n=1 Tax=Gossypium anomalum TaxID=47600 RepID=A0A8J5YWU8_9ROSI|nr:hypothetical protein CXB51_019858 [Gossypium anomalum]